MQVSELKFFSVGFVKYARSTIHSTKLFEYEIVTAALLFSLFKDLSITMSNMVRRTFRYTPFASNCSDVGYGLTVLKQKIFHVVEVVLIKYSSFTCSLKLP